MYLFNIFEIFQYQFMIKALIIGSLLAIITSLIGLIVVLRRLSMVGDALAHSSLAGVAFGLLLGFNPVLGALLASILAAFSIEALRKAFKRYSEISIAILLSTGIGLAGNFSVFLKSNSNFNSFLFGSIVTISDFEFYLVISVSVLVMLISLLFYKELFAFSFDEEAARLSGVPVFFVNSIFTLLTALTLSVASRTVGSLIISSLLVIPVASSLQIAKNYKQALIYSITISLLTTISGLIISFYFNLKPGATIVLLSVVVLLLILGIKATHKNWQKNKTLYNK